MSRVVIQVWRSTPDGQESLGYITMQAVTPLTSELQKAAVFWSKRDAYRWLANHANRRGLPDGHLDYEFEVVIFSLAPENLDA